jgi:hypothetical protein
VSYELWAIIVGALTICAFLSSIERKLMKIVDELKFLNHNERMREFWQDVDAGASRLKADREEAEGKPE